MLGGEGLLEGEPQVGGGGIGIGVGGHVDAIGVGVVDGQPVARRRRARCRPTVGSPVASPSARQIGTCASQPSSTTSRPIVSA